MILPKRVIGRVHNATVVEITVGIEAFERVKNILGNEGMPRCGWMNFIPELVIFGVRNDVARTVKEVPRIQSWCGWAGHIRESVLTRGGKYLLK